MKQEDEADGEVASMALLRRHLEAVAEKGSEVTLFLLYKPPLISGAHKGVPRRGRQTRDSSEEELARCELSSMSRLECRPRARSKPRSVAKTHVTVCFGVLIKERIREAWLLPRTSFLI